MPSPFFLLIAILCGDAFGQELNETIATPTTPQPADAHPHQAVIEQVEQDVRICLSDRIVVQSQIIDRPTQTWVIVINNPYGRNEMKALTQCVYMDNGWIPTMPNHTLLVEIRRDEKLDGYTYYRMSQEQRDAFFLEPPAEDKKLFAKRLLFEQQRRQQEQEEAQRQWQHQQRLIEQRQREEDRWNMWQQQQYYQQQNQQARQFLPPPPPFYGFSNNP